MARFNGGYVKLYRSIADTDPQQNIYYGKGIARLVFETLFIWANRYEGKTILNHQKRAVGRGQVVTSTHELEKQLGLTRQNIRSAINWLKSTNQITSEATNAGTVITIVDYDKFQCSDDELNQQPNQQPNQHPTNAQPMLNQHPTNAQPHNGEYKNNKNTRITRKQETVSLYTPDGGDIGKPTRDEKIRSKAHARDIELAERWYAWAKENDPNTRYNLTSFIEDITKLKATIQDHMAFDDVHHMFDYLFEWIQHDNFWSENAKSPCGLKNKSKADKTLRKFDQILKRFTSEYNQSKKKHDGMQAWIDGSWEHPLQDIIDDF